MAQVFKDGFESNDFSAWDEKQNGSLGNGVYTLTPVPTGMTGTYCCRFDATYGGIVRKAITPRVDIYVRFKYRCNFSETQGIICSFWSAGGYECRLSSLDDGNVRLDRAPGNTIANSGAGVISDQTTHDLQIYFKLGDNPQGRCVVKVDGSTVIDYTGDTKYTTNTNITDFVLGQNASGYASGWYDDVELDDATYPGPWVSGSGIICPWGNPFRRVT